jgi:hypothetical protein
MIKQHCSAGKYSETQGEDKLTNKKTKNRCQSVHLVSRSHLLSVVLGQERFLQTQGCIIVSTSQDRLCRTMTVFVSPVTFFCAGQGPSLSAQKLSSSER